MEIKNLNDEQIIKYIRAKMYAYNDKIESMIEGLRYYRGEHDIKTKQRLGIGEGGRMIPIVNLPNLKILDNQYKRAVDQKVNYLFSALPEIKADGNMEDILDKIIDRRFLRTLNKIALDVYNCGIAWLYVFYDKDGIKYKKLNPKDVIPIWTDDTHESLEGVIYKYSYEDLKGDEVVKKEGVYFYTKDFIRHYLYESGELILKDESGYLERGGVRYSFDSIPFIYFKSPDESPLLKRIKCLQDALNLLMSNFGDNMLEDPRNTVLVLKNYDGEDLGEFRQKLSQLGAIKVTSADGMQGGVETLTINVNCENYESIIRLLKLAITDNARSLDLKLYANASNAPNMLNIKAMYSDVELDANAMELEFSASMEHFCKIISQAYNININIADFRFKRNIMINEESLVQMIRNSIGIVSDETLRNKHPLVDDAKLEEERIKKEKSQEFDTFGLGHEHE